MDAPSPSARKAVVVGAGPVGCLAAVAFAALGWHVEIYEARPDMRLPASKAAAQQRSINLAISSRGIAALQAVLGPAATERFLETVIPMRARMIHREDGKLDSQAYDRHGQCINSIDRALLNENLLDETLANPLVRVFFRHKISAVDFENRVMGVHDMEGGKDIRVAFDLCIGADGSYSVVRRQMMRAVRMNFQQEYISHEYVELKMPAARAADGTPGFLLDPNHLHIWPRHSFMLIALPNKDYSFTCTLFAPTSDFSYLSDASRPEKLEWFRKYFPDALPLIGEGKLLEDLEKNPRSALISIKAAPYHYKDRVIILGDAAHSMVPFYGQGLNCGLEDVRVLYNLLRTRAQNFSSSGPPEPELLSVSEHESSATIKAEHTDQALLQVLEEYSRTRHEDLIAICELAMDNYVEMRHSVTTLGYLFKKRLDNILAAFSADTPPIGLSSSDNVPASGPSFVAHPRGWLPLYTMVTFRPDISYATAKRKAEAQARTLSTVGWALTAVSSAGAVWAVFAGSIALGKFMRGRR